MAAEGFHADRRTDMTKLTVSFLSETSRCDKNIYQRKDSIVYHNNVRIISRNVSSYMLRLADKTAISRQLDTKGILLYGIQFFVLVVLRYELVYRKMCFL